VSAGVDDDLGIGGELSALTGLLLKPTIIDLELRVEIDEEQSGVVTVTVSVLQQ